MIPLAFSHVHVVVPVHSVKQGEDIMNEIQQRISGIGFPPFGISYPALVLIGIVVIGLLVSYSFAGKGTGSHAGREEVRRAYRRKLAQEMAKDDAQKIKRGEKPRRRWMQW